MRGFLVVVAIIVGVSLVIVGYGDAPKDKAVTTVAGLEVVDLASANDSAEGWLSGEVTGARAIQAPLSGERVAWWQTVSVSRIENTEQRCTGTDCTDETTVNYVTDSDERADASIPLDVRGEQLEVSIPYATLREAMDADGGDGAIDGLKSNDSASGGDGTDKATTRYEYVVRNGDRLTIIGKFSKQGDRWHATAFESVPIASDRTFGAFRDEVLGTKKSTDQLKLAGFALIGGAIGYILWSIVQGRRRRRKASKLPQPETPAT